MPEHYSMADRKIFWMRICIVIAAAFSYVFNYVYAKAVLYNLSYLENLPVLRLNLDRGTTNSIMNSIINLSLYEIVFLAGIIFGNDALRKILKRACRLLIIFLILFGCKASRDVRNSFEEKAKLMKVEMFNDEHLDELHALQTKLKCCGAESYLDFNLHITSSCFKMESTICTLPFSCFKAEAFQTPSLEIEYDDLTATWKNGNIEKAAEVIYMKGCSEILRKIYDRTSHIILVFCVIAASVQTLLFLFISHFLEIIDEIEENHQDMHDD